MNGCVKTMLHRLVQCVWSKKFWRLLKEVCGAGGKLLLEMLGYNEGYRMCAGEEIGGESRFAEPGGIWGEGGDGQHDSDAEQDAAGEAEECSEEAVEEAEADGGDGLFDEAGGEGEGDHDEDQDGEERDDLGDGEAGDEGVKALGEGEVVPGGEEDAEDEAAEREEDTDDAALEGG